MRNVVLAAVLGGLVAVGGVAPARAAGCVSGAVVGGVAGHFAGHGVLGAAAGCAIGHHRAKVQREQEEGRSGPDRAMYGSDAYNPDQPH